MTIRDIEETIHTLTTRHPGLDEAMLLTLLKAGGWEDKDIQTAKMLFKPLSPTPPVPQIPVAPPAPPVAPVEQPPVSATLHVQEEKKEETKEPVPVKNFPPTQESPLLMPTLDEAHLVEAPHGDVIQEPAHVEAPPVPEPVSLIRTEERSAASGREDLPHNLPLRPFETSEHIWPFSRYRDVFYGEEVSVPVPVQPVPVRQPASPPQTVIAPTQVAVNVNPPAEKVEPPILTPPPSSVPQPQPVQAREPVFRAPPEVEKKVVIVEKTGDEKLVVMACVMLLAILLLLGYMYSNGRL